MIIWSTALSSWPICFTENIAEELNPIFLSLTDEKKEAISWKRDHFKNLNLRVLKTQDKNYENQESHDKFLTIFVLT